MALQNPFGAGYGQAVENTIPWGGASTEAPAESAAEAALRYRMHELERREQQLAAREAQLRVQEDKIGEFLGRQPNFPKFRPLVYHDIDKEIPDAGKPLVKRAYLLWLFCVWAYFFNCLACFTTLVTKGANGGSQFGMSFLIMSIGIPVSWSFWYKQLYDGVRDDKSLRFFFFFFNFAFHLGAMAVLAIGMPGWGGAGIIVAMDMFGTNAVSGVFCLISAACLGLEAMAGLWVLKEVTSYYRSKGMSMRSVRTEAIHGVAQSELGREVLKEGAKQAFVANKSAALAVPTLAKPPSHVPSLSKPPSVVPTLRK
ncbi:hypothetical protein GGF32_003571 [Allomyces javanicus]|nr:hypothetical protein GGF32_003571 [Allomyces javanicus]